MSRLVRIITPPPSMADAIITGRPVPRALLAALADRPR